jgi:hypothetical protein
MRVGVNDADVCGSTDRLYSCVPAEFRHGNELYGVVLEKLTVA